MFGEVTQEYIESLFAHFAQQGGVLQRYVEDTLKLGDLEKTAEIEAEMAVWLAKQPRPTAYEA